MKTTIVLDDDLITRAMDITGSSSKKETIEQALKLLLSFSMQKGIKKLRGKIKWVGNIEQMRSDT